MAMKPFLFSCCLFLICLFSSCNSSTKNVVENKKYFISIHATNKLQNKNLTGHMFVEYYVTLNGIKQSVGKFGFGPSSNYSIADWLQGKVVEGHFDYEEDQDIDGDSKYEKEVTQSLYNNALNIKKNWENSSLPYQAGKTDCITYAMEVAKAINTKIPTRGSTDFPIDLMKKYILLNK